MNNHLPAEGVLTRTHHKKFSVGWIVSVILSFTLLALVFTGCTPKEKESPDLPGVFTTKASMAIGKELKAECGISRSGPGVWAVEFTSPSTLQGIGLGFERLEDGSMEIVATYLGLSFKLPETAMPAQNALKSMIEGLEMCIGDRELPMAEENGQRIFHGVTASGEEFLLGLDAKDNSFQTFSVDKQDLKIIFTEFAPSTLNVPDTTAVSGSSDGTAPSETSVSSGGSAVTTTVTAMAAGEGKADSAAAKPRS